MIPTPLATAAVRAILEPYNRNLLQALQGAILGLRLPDEDHPCFAAIFHHQSGTGGILIYRGTDALDNLAESFARREPARSEVWGIQIDRPAAVPTQMRSIAATAGYSGRLIPTFLVASKDQPSREPYAGELRKMIAAMRGLSMAHDQGILAPLPFAGSDPLLLQVLTVRGKGRELSVTAATETFETPRPLRKQASPAGESPAWESLDHLPRLDAEWHVALNPLGTHADAAMPRFVLAVADASEGVPFQLSMLGGGEPGDDDTERAGERLREAFTGDNLRRITGVPRRIVFAQGHLHDALAPSLRELGVECALDPELDVLPDHTEMLVDQLRGPRDPEVVPAADDRFGWVAVRRRLRARMKARKEWTPHTLPPRLQFFGAPIQLESIDHPLAAAAYDEWFLLHYRGKPGRRTVAERLLADALPEPERMQLEAWIEGRIGMWQVDSIAGAAVHLADRLSGERASVEDRMLAKALNAGDCAPGSVSTLLGTASLQFFGPPLAARFVDAALGFLERTGLLLTPEGAAAAPHRLGQLWLWRPTGHATGRRDTGHGGAPPATTDG